MYIQTFNMEVDWSDQKLDVYKWSIFAQSVFLLLGADVDLYIRTFSSHMKVSLGYKIFYEKKYSIYF